MEFLGTCENFYAQAKKKGFQMLRASQTRPRSVLECLFDRISCFLNREVFFLQYKKKLDRFKIFVGS